VSRVLGAALRCIEARVHAAAHHLQHVPMGLVRKPLGLLSAAFDDAGHKFGTCDLGLQPPVLRGLEDLRAVKGHAEGDASEFRSQHGHGAAGSAQVVVQVWMARRAMAASLRG